VAVKVQHRYVKKHSFVDIVTMDFLVRVVNYAFPQFEFMWLADELRKNLPLELDFLQEGHNAEKVSNLFAHLNWLKVPKIYWPLSTDRVLIMEYCSGKTGITCSLFLSTEVKQHQDSQYLDG
jgi:aarF domain-containing kinase